MRYLDGQMGSDAALIQLDDGTLIAKCRRGDIPGKRGAEVWYELLAVAKASRVPITPVPRYGTVEFRKKLEAVVAELKKEDVETHAIDDLKKQGVF